MDERMFNMQEITLKATTDNLSTVTGFIDGILEENNCPMAIHMQVDISLEEIFVNIAHYAYTPDEGDATIRCGVEDNVLTIEFIDSGKPFDPLKKPDPDVTLSADERKIGGLGIYMVKNYMDSVSYEYTDNKNKLVIVKKLG